MAGIQNDHDDGINEINVTPFVDVMLVLLVIFMVTANYIAHQSINIQLPKAATGADSATTSIAFALDKQSQLYIDGKESTLADIKAYVEDKKKAGTPLNALISADQATSHGDVIKLIDAVRKNGILDFAINVEVEAAPPTP